ncbi:MAG: DUF302 domain-containing protein [Bdellovibrionales bacterium]|nr:DUF302 domain-containing protein [Bdellovibrionales bacterium]
MSYFFSKSLDCSFDQGVSKVTEKLKQHGFGVLTEINIQETLKKKIDVDFYKYKILGACHPHSAFEALSAEDKIGLMLPCNVIVQQKEPDGPVEISGIDPVASMASVHNPALGGLAQKIQSLMKQVIAEL